MTHTYHIGDMRFTGCTGSNRTALPSTSDIRRAEANGWPAPRRIGGDAGDLFFSEAWFDASSVILTLSNVSLRTTAPDLTPDEAFDAAYAIFDAAWDSVGPDCVS